MNKTIYDLAKKEKSYYESTPIRVFDNFEWNMYDHIKKTVYYKNSRYTKGNNDQKPFKNIIRPILNVQHRAEGFDVKDIELFVDDEEEYYKSFLARKFHDKWAYENSIDTFIDKLVENFIDFGGVLVKKTKNGPETVPWQRIAFVDQTNIMSGPIAEAHFYNPDELRREAEKRGWDTDAVDMAIWHAEKEKKTSQSDKNETPGRYIKVYEVHGVFPKSFLDEDDNPKEYSRQVHIITFYRPKKGADKEGITLFKNKEPKNIYKYLPRDEIYGRALGMGGAEELFESQVWLNYDMIRMKEMMDQASKMIYQTADKSFKTKNKNLSKSDNGDINIHKPGQPLQRVDNSPFNIDVFNASVQAWEAHAQQVGSATEPVLGEQPPSGTPFRLQALVTQQATSLHEYRKGKLATFLGEIYRDWVIPTIKKEITKGSKFVEELDLSDLQEIAQTIGENKSNKEVKERILDGELVFRDEIEGLEQEIRERVISAGGKKFIEILEGEFKDSPLDIKVNIAGKQKDLNLISDKLTNVFRQIIQAPQVLQNPEMAKLFNEILESSGLSPIDFAGFQQAQPAQQAQPTLQPTQRSTVNQTNQQ